LKVEEQSHVMGEARLYKKTRELARNDRDLVLCLP
jgi:hypothetical protein